MARLPAEISEFMEKYGVRSDEVWPVPGGKSYAVKHKALERIANNLGIIIETIELKVCDIANKMAVVRATGKLKDRCVTSLGEAAPYNNKNGYPIAMAEKRACDRVILKLLAVHGDIYGESEIDNSNQPNSQTIHETLPEDVGPVANEDIIERVDGIQVLTVDAQRPIYAELTKELATCDTVQDTKRWKLTARSRASRLSDNWRKMLDGEYLKHIRALEKREALEYQERMTG